MKKNKTMHKVLAFLLVMVLILLCGCSKKTSSPTPFTGKWAFIHDTETAVLTIKDDGTAVYEGTKYNFSYDNSFFELSADDKSTLKFRYVQDDDGIYFYIPTEYLLVDSEGSNGLIGTWYCKEKKWSFEFTSDGTFKEDGYFPGYFIDNNDGTFKLIYNDHFEDTLCYYSISGDTLTVEYPWRLVKMQ